MAAYGRFFAFSQRFWAAGPSDPKSINFSLVSQSVKGFLKRLSAPPRQFSGSHLTVMKWSSLQPNESLKSAPGAPSRHFREPLNDCKTLEEIELSLGSMDPMAQNQQKMVKNKWAAICTIYTIYNLRLLDLFGNFFTFCLFFVFETNILVSGNIKQVS